MAAVLDISPSERELESLWRTFHRSWVAVSDELARAEAQLRAESDPRIHAAQEQVAHALRRHERHARDMLEHFERRAREFRSRTATYRPRYE
ncbi:MAG TPA: hypothetical protein VIE63_13345 [Ramlibacter sp.]